MEENLTSESLFLGGRVPSLPPDSWVQSADDVEVTNLVTVPRVFIEDARVHSSRSTELGIARVSIEMVAGKEHVVGVGFDRPLTPMELAEIDWVRLLREALLLRAMKRSIANLTTVGGDLDAAEAAVRDLATEYPQGAPTARTYNRMRRDDYRRVASAVEKGGLAQVRNDFHVSLRTANRYVKKAKELGIL
jgi:hypothetical protein